MKVSGNLVVTGMIALLVESLTLGGRHRLDLAAMIDILEAIDLTSPLLSGKGSLLLENDFASRFPLRHAVKDVRLARSVAAGQGLTFAVVDGAKTLFRRTAEAGESDSDSDDHGGDRAIGPTIA